MSSDAWGAGNLHCSDLRVRGPHLHIDRERSSRRKKLRENYPGNACIAASSVFERSLPGLKAVDWRWPLAGQPEEPEAAASAERVLPTERAAAVL